MGANGSEDSVTNKPSAYILWSISFIIISCPLLHISVTFHTDGLWSSRFCWLLYSLRRRENYLHGSPRAAVHLMLWTGGVFSLALLLTRASLRLPRPSIPYISGTSSSFSLFHPCWSWEREIVALDFVNSSFTSVSLSVAILEAVLLQKVILPVSSISSSLSFLLMPE